MDTQSSHDPERMRVRQLSPGMVLAREVHTDDGSQLFQSGRQLSMEDIDRLNRFDIRAVQIESGSLDTDE